jgi:hypothetical protein
MSGTTTAVIGSAPARCRRRPGRYLFGRAFLDFTLMGSGGAEGRRSAISGLRRPGRRFREFSLKIS